MNSRTGSERAVACLLWLTILGTAFGSSLATAAPSSAIESGTGTTVTQNKKHTARLDDLGLGIPEPIQAGDPNDLEELREVDDLSRQDEPFEVQIPDEQVNECGGPSRDPFEAAAESSGLSEEDAEMVAALQARAGGALSVPDSNFGVQDSNLGSPAPKQTVTPMTPAERSAFEAAGGIAAGLYGLAGTHPVAVTVVTVLAIAGQVPNLDPYVGDAKPFEGRTYLDDLGDKAIKETIEAIDARTEAIEADDVADRAEANNDDNAAEKRVVADAAEAKAQAEEAEAELARETYRKAVEAAKETEGEAGDNFEPGFSDPEDQMIWEAHFSHLDGTPWDQGTKVDALDRNPATGSDPRVTNPGPEESEQGPVRPNGVGTGVVDPDTPETMSSAAPAFDCGIVEALVERGQPGSLPPEVSNPNPNDDPESGEETSPPPLPVNNGQCEVCDLDARMN